MRDGRVHFILILALLYLAQGLFGEFCFSQLSAPGNTAYLQSSREKLVLQEGPAPVHEKGQALPAAHTPFFFLGVPINSADKEMLMTVKGIGPALADSIIACRGQFGPFKDVEDLMQVPGVGAKRAASLAPFLQFDEVP